MRDASATEKDEKEAGLGMATLELFVDERNEGVTLQKLNRHHDKALILGDINIDLNSDKNLVCLTDYSHILQSNAFISLIDKPTRVTRTSQTVIDHILTNDCESILTPGVLTTTLLTIILYFVPFLILISKAQKMKNRILSVTLPPLIETNSAMT